MVTAACDERVAITNDVALMGRTMERTEHHESSREARTLVIMPAWNEEEAIGATIAEIRQEAPGVDIVVVNDGSTDNTSRVARNAGALVIDQLYNMGVGAAMRTGYRYAQQQGYDYALQVDSDGQHDPRSIADLLQAIDGYDIVVGTRFAEGSDYKVSGPRKWAMGLLSFLFTRAAGTPFTDVTSGFKIANRTGIDFYVKNLPAEYLGDTVNITAMAIRNGLRVRQVPVTMRERQGGEPSSGPVKSAVYLVRSLFSYAISMSRKKQEL